jgi:hypothetical protein
MTRADVEAAARRFLAIGGRVMIWPDGRLQGAISVAAIYSLNLTPEQTREREAVSRNFSRAEHGARATLADLTRTNGRPENGFIIWEGAA